MVLYKSEIKHMYAAKILQYTRKQNKQNTVSESNFFFYIIAKITVLCIVLL